MMDRTDEDRAWYITWAVSRFRSWLVSPSVLFFMVLGVATAIVGGASWPWIVGLIVASLVVLYVTARFV